MDLRSALIFGVLIPASIAGIVLWFRGRGAGEERPARVFVGALALGLGHLVADSFLVGMPRLPSAHVEITMREWIAWFVLGAIVLSPMRTIDSLARWSNPLYIALFSVLTFRFPLQNLDLIPRCGLTFVMYVAWNASDRLAERLRGPALPAAWTVAGTGIALSSLYSHAASTAQLAGALTAGLGAAAVVATIDKGARFPAGAVAIVWIVFAGLLVDRAVYGMPIVAIALFVIALLAPWCAAQKRFERRPLAQTLSALLASAIPTGIAVLLAYNASAGSR